MGAGGEDGGRDRKDRAETWLDRRFEPLYFRLRYVILVPSVASFFGALLMFGAGLREVYAAAVGFPAPDPVTIHVIKAVDIFILGLVLIIFAYGSYDLFISELEPARSSKVGPDWMRFNDVGQLKTVLVEVVLVVLVILYFEVIKMNIDTLTSPVHFLVIPLGILMIAYGIGNFKQLTK